MKSTLPINILFHLLLGASVSAISITDTSTTKTAFSEDLVILHQSLIANHAGAFQYITDDDLQKHINIAIDTMSATIQDADAYLIASRLVAKVKCAHTSVEVSDRFVSAVQKQNILPFEFKFIDRRLYVLKNYADSSIELGAEILTIEGEPVAGILNELLSVVPSDGLVTTSKYRTIEAFLYFNVLYTMIRGNKSGYKISYKALNSNETNLISVKGVPLATMHDLFNAQVKKEQSPFNLSIDKESLTATLTISTFDGSAYKANKQKYIKLLKASFATIAEEGVTSLIIDLRDNGGGEDDYGARLYAYLTDKRFNYYERLSLTSTSMASRSYTDFGFIKRQGLKLLTKFDKESGRYVLRGKNLHEFKSAKNNFAGKLYVLINGRSFSASSEFCTVAKEHNRAVFIGEEGGGSYHGNTSGFFFTLTLPNSGLRVHIPGIHYQMATTTNYQFGRGLVPDHEIIPTITELLSGVDMEIKKAQQLIMEQSGKSFLH